MSKENDLKKQIKKQIYGNPNWINGRINRAEYLFRGIGLSCCFYLCMTGALALYAAGNTVPVILLGIFALWVYWLIMMTYVKRLHDLGWSGWLAVLVAFGGLASIFIENNVIIQVLNMLSFVLGLFLLFRKGDDGANKYGKDPLMKYEENQ